MNYPSYGILASQPKDVLFYISSSPKVKRLLGEVTRTDGVVFPSIQLSSLSQSFSFSNVTGLRVTVSAASAHVDKKFENGAFRRYSVITLYTAQYGSKTVTDLVTAMAGLGYTKVEVSDSDESEFSTVTGGTGDHSGASSYNKVVFDAGKGRAVSAPGQKWGEFPEASTDNEIEVQSLINASLVDYARTTEVTAAINSAYTPSENLNSESAGYLFQNSSYFALGGTHTGNPDVIEDVEADTLTTIKFTNAGASESGQELPSSFGGSSLYDRSTGVISLAGMQKESFIMVRVNCDVDPTVDESQALIVLECQANGTSGAFTFEIEALLVSMSQGADRDYSGLANVPIFIGDTLKDDGSTLATVTPRIKLVNTAGDLKPRTLALYVWK